jgi:hypothetical protein
VKRSLEQYDAFYREAHRVLSTVQAQGGPFVVLDLHTYNHRRDGPDAPAADPTANPEVNVGTESVTRERWGPLIDRFMSDLRAQDFLGRHLDVRENVKFRGGRFARWVHETFGPTACALAIEFKKFFMDEWSGTLDRAQHEAIHAALRSTLPGLLEEIARVRAAR